MMDFGPIDTSDLEAEFDNACDELSAICSKWNELFDLELASDNHDTSPRFDKIVTILQKIERISVSFITDLHLHISTVSNWTNELVEEYHVFMNLTDIEQTIKPHFPNVFNNELGDELNLAYTDPDAVERLKSNVNLAALMNCAFAKIEIENILANVFPAPPLPAPPLPAYGLIKALIADTTLIITLTNAGQFCDKLNNAKAILELMIKLNTYWTDLFKQSHSKQFINLLDRLEQYSINVFLTDYNNLSVFGNTLQSTFTIIKEWNYLAEKIKKLQAQDTHPEIIRQLEAFFDDSENELKLKCDINHLEQLPFSELNSGMQRHNSDCIGLILRKLFLNEINLEEFLRHLKSTQNEVLQPATPSIAAARHTNLVVSTHSIFTKPAVLNKGVAATVSSDANSLN